MPALLLAEALRRHHPGMSACARLLAGLAFLGGCSAAPDGGVAPHAPSPVATPLVAPAPVAPTNAAPAAAAPPARNPELEAAAARCAPGLRFRTTIATLAPDAQGTRDACLTLFLDAGAARALLSPRCKQGSDADACMLLAATYAPPQWMTDEDFSVFAPPCKSKQSCWTFLRSRIDPAGPLGPTDERAATEALELACRGGTPAACEILSRARAATKRGDADEAQARACELGMDVSCRKLVYEFGKRNLTLESSTLEAILKTERAACERPGGVGASCLSLATLVDMGWANEQQAGAVGERLVRGCELGHGIACAKAMQLHASGKRKASKPELARAASVLGTACAPDQPFPCAMLAVALKRGLGVDKDPKRAASVWKAACETPEKACRDVGVRP
jgi:TPR repeat protein